MAHFYGGVKGSKEEATRLGDKKSGLRAFANGLNIGVHVRLHYCKDTDEDVVFVTLTNGSNGNGRDKILGRFTTKDLKGE